MRPPGLCPAPSGHPGPSLRPHLGSFQLFFRSSILPVPCGEWQRSYSASDCLHRVLCYLCYSPMPSSAGHGRHSLSGLVPASPGCWPHCFHRTSSSVHQTSGSQRLGCSLGWPHPLVHQLWYQAHQSGRLGDLICQGETLHLLA